MAWGKSVAKPERATPWRPSFHQSYGRNAEAGNCRGGVDELSGFFVEGHAGDEIVDALLNGERGVEVR